MAVKADPKLSNKEIGKALKLIRIYSNRKSADLAKKIGISSGYASELEGGAKTISIEILQRYGQEFNLPPTFFLSFAQKLKNNKKLENKIFESIIKTIEECEG